MVIKAEEGEEKKVWVRSECTQRRKEGGGGVVGIGKE